MKRVKRVNNEVKKSNEVVKSESVINTESYVVDKLKKIDYSKSNAIIKAISNIAFLFAAIRSAILSYVTKESDQALHLHLFTNDDRIKLLRKSKKDRDLFLTLCDIAAFNYKRIVKKDSNKVDQISYHKAYSVRSVLNACDIYLQTSSVEMTKEYVQDIRFEREKEAIQKLKNQIANMQESANILSSTIESLKVDQDANKDLIIEYADQLAKVEKQLKNKSELLDYVSIASNRINIKSK